jgi:SAM-dependent methyltransferase
MQDVVAREEAIKQWSANPCGAVGGDEGTLEYFLEVERNRYQQQPWQREVLHFEQYAGQRVLEIGVGLGTDLVQFAKAGALCSGIDITDRHLELTGRNFALRAYEVDLRKCDATRIDHPDGRFDCVYSFGVIHHIPDALSVLREIKRVLRPGGKLILALYHTWSLFHLYMLLVPGILRGRLFRLGYSGLMSTIEAGADGIAVKPYVRVYSRREVRALLADFESVRVSAHHVELGRFRTTLPGRLTAPILRLLEPWFGWYLVAEAIRPAG